MKWSTVDSWGQVRGTIPIAIRNKVRSNVPMGTMSEMVDGRRQGRVRYEVRFTELNIE